MDADTLVVASGEALPHAENEVNAVVNSGLRVHVLEGDQATRSNVLDLAKRHQWKRWWFVAHGDAHGVYLTDAILSTSLLTQYARRAGIEFLFLNTCESEDIARLIQQELRIVLICTIGKIDDYTAYSTGTLLADAIAKTGNYWQAFTASKPGQSRDYIFLPENYSGMMSQNGNGGVEGRLRKVEKDIDRLLVIVQGDEGYNVVGLQNEVMRLRNDVHALRNDINSQFMNVRSQLTDRPTELLHQPWFVWLLSVSVVILVIGMVVLIAAALGWIGTPGEIHAVLPRFN